MLQSSCSGTRIAARPAAARLAAAAGEALREDIVKEIPAELERALSTRLADISGISVKDLFSRRRTRDIAQVRFALWLALYRRGYGPSAIGRMAERSPDTVRYGVRTASARPDLLSLASELMTGVLPSSPPRILTVFGVEVAARVHRFLGELVDGERFTSAGILGLAAIAGNVALQEAVYRMLDNRGLALQYWRIQHAAQRAGFRWTFAAAPSGVAR